MNKKKLSRIMTSLLAGVMTVGMLVGCGSQDVNEKSKESESQPSKSQAVESTDNVSAEPQEITYPLTDAEDVSWFVVNQLGLHSEYTDALQSPFHSGLSEMTGINIDWQFVPQGADSGQTLELLIQEEDCPNIIFWSGFKANKAQEYYNEGLIYDLTDYLPIYAPDYWEFINLPENAENLQTLKDGEGRLLTIGSFKESDYCITYLGPVVRKDWLEECGLDMPVTVQDWEEVLIAFKEKYNATLGFSLNRFNNAGFASGTGAFAPLKMKYYVDDNNQIQLANACPEWKEFLEVMNRWYEMGLIDKDFAIADDTTMRAKALNNEIGASYTAMSQITNWIADAQTEGTGAEWVAAEYLRESEGQPTNYIYTTRTTLDGGNAAVISTSASEEQLITALKLLNYGFTEEGRMYWNFGKEGVSYELGENGNPQFTELVTGDVNGINAGVQKYTGVHSAGACVQTEAYAHAKYAPYGDFVYTWVENTEAAKHCVPSGLPTTDEEVTLISDLETPISTYIEEMALKFVTGEESLDNFDKYVEKLNEMDLAELLEVKNAAYERYQGN